MGMNIETTKVYLCMADEERTHSFILMPRILIHVLDRGGKQRHI